MPNSSPQYANPITRELVDRYSEDGVVMLKGAIDIEWIEKLRRGVEYNIENPSDCGRVWDRDEFGGVTFFDCQAWQQIPEYRDFVENSPIAELAGTIMDCDSVNFFYDAIFSRTTGNQFRTPFHQDEPYWSVSGFDCCSIWMPLVPVEKKSALEFVKGSHRWEQKFKQTNFGALTSDERDQVVFDDEDTVEFPDIEANRNQYDILSWDMEPGDIAMFNARIIHGGSGLLAADRDLKVFNTQWTGDDVRVIFRPEGMDPDHSETMRSLGLKPGDRLSGSRYPQLWSRS